MKCFAVIDTNVLVSALLSVRSDSATVQVLNRVFKGDVIPVFDDEIIAEYRNVLNRKKFGFDHETVNRLINNLIGIGVYVRPVETHEALPDMKDLPFYEVAMSAQDVESFLVTGNIRHFPQKPFVVTPRRLSGILDSN